MIHQLNSLYPVRYTAFALCVFGVPPVLSNAPRHVSSGVRHAVMK